MAHNVDVGSRCFYQNMFLFPVWLFVFIYKYIYKGYFTPFTFRGRNSPELLPDQFHKEKPDWLSLFKTSNGKETV